MRVVVIVVTCVLVAIVGLGTFAIVSSSGAAEARADVQPGRS